MELTVIRHSDIYIGRTKAFYEPNDDSLYEEEEWAWSQDEDDSSFVPLPYGSIDQLTAEGAEILKRFLAYRRMNGYQRSRCGIEYGEYRYMSWNDMWLHLYNNGHFIDGGYDTQAVHITVAIPMDDTWDTKEDVGMHKQWSDARLQAAYENACDCHYYGDGKSAWLREGLTPEEEALVWDEAFDTVSEGYRY